jgi:hypothetical protein
VLVSGTIDSNGNATIRSVIAKPVLIHFIRPHGSQLMLPTQHSLTHISTRP